MFFFPFRQHEPSIDHSAFTDTAPSTPCKIGFQNKEKFSNDQRTFLWGGEVFQRATKLSENVPHRVGKKQTVKVSREDEYTMGCFEVGRLARSTRSILRIELEHVDCLSDIGDLFVGLI